MRSPRQVLILIALAVAAYAPALRLPFIDDDYPEIPLARNYALEGWAPLWHDSNLRARATNMVLNATLDRVFGFTPVPFYVVSILVHVLCVLLMYAACVWSEVLDETTAFWAACFFAVYEGHQEAVMWISARNESLLFLFGMAAWVCWVKFLRTRGLAWYGLSIVALVLAALSKEAFVVFPVLMLLPLIALPPATSRKAALLAVIPFFAITIAYLAWTWSTRVAQPGYSDIRFSLSAPWPLVLVKSMWRMLFAWGVAALAIVLWAGWRADRNKIFIGLAWMLIGIFPYCFLTYMPQVASRHTYVASAGLALLVGAAAARLAAMDRRVLLHIACVGFLAVNLDILWVKKMSQLRERAEPSELLKAAAAEAQGPVTVRCIPFTDYVTGAVLATVGHPAVFATPMEHDDHCFSVAYQTPAGAYVQVHRRIRTAKHGLLY